MSFLSGYLKRKTCYWVINNTVLADYQIKIIPHKDTGADSGADVYLGTSVQDDFDDIRLTKGDGETLWGTDYQWREDYTSGDNAVYWQKVGKVGSSLATEDYSIAETEIDVADASVFAENDYVIICDDTTPAGEVRQITGIAGNTLTVAGLTNAYTTADNAKVCHCSYLYYNNDAAELSSSGDDTFDFFDDFPGDSLDTDKWDNTDGLTCSVADSILTASASGVSKFIYSKNLTFSHGTAIRAYAKWSVFATLKYAAWGYVESGGDFIKILPTYDNAPVDGYASFKKSGSTSAAQDLGLVKADVINYSIWDVLRLSDSVVIKVDDVTKLTYTDTGYIDTDALPGSIGSYTSGVYGYYDWFLIRKYISPEPSHGAWGSEETATYTETVSLDALLQAQDEKTVTLDALLRGTVPTTVDVDALLEATDNKAVDLDALLVAKPTAITQEATNIGQTTARINGKISDDGAATCEARFRWRKTGGTEEQTLSSIEEPLHSTSSIRAGQRLIIPNRTVISLSFLLRKSGSPTGDVTFTIRAVSDDHIIASKVWGDASGLKGGVGQTWEQVTFDTPTLINEEVRILVEYSGGNSSNYVRFRIQNTDVKANEICTQYPYNKSSYTAYPTYDSAYKYIYGEDWVETDWQNTLETNDIYYEDLTDLDSSTEYEFQTQAKNAAGTSEWTESDTFETTAADTYTKIVSMDALLRAQDEETVALDAYLQATDAETILLDALLKAIDVKSANLDTLLQATDSTTVDLDALVKALDTKTLSVDALVKGLGLSKTVVLDAIIGLSAIKISLDTLLKGEASTQADLDALVQALDKQDIALDALIAARDLESISIDTLLRGLDTKAITLDAYIKAVNIVESVNLDALIQELGLEKIIAIDALIEAKGIQTLDLDALLKGTGTATINLDAIIGIMSYFAAVNLDVILFKALPPNRIYTIEIRNGDGELLAILENAHGIGYAQTINAPHSLRFAMPADDSKSSNILLANEYWLRDNRTDTIIRKFRLQRKVDTR